MNLSLDPGASRAVIAPEHFPPEECRIRLGQHAFERGGAGNRFPDFP